MAIDDFAARAAAEEIIRELDIRAPDEIDVDAIACRYGAYVRDGPLDGAEGRLLRGARKAIILIRESIRESGKRRFVIAHELGHLRLHRALNQIAMCTDRDLHDWYRKNGSETESNLFASALLLPEGLFRPQCDVREPSLGIVADLAEKFGTTLTATALRFLDYCDERCALVFSKGGQIEWAKPTRGFGYRITKGATLSKWSYAWDASQGKAVPARFSAVSADTWIESSRVGSNDDVEEHSVAMPAYDAVLTMLWIRVDAGY